MALLFLLMALVIGLIAFRSHTGGIVLWFITLGLSSLMFWHHATKILNINW